MYKNISQKQIRKDNARKVLQLLIKSDSLTRKDIAEKSGVSPSTVTQIITPLIEQGIVIEIKEGESTGGRKPIFIQFNKNYGRIAIVDISDMGTSVYLFDLKGNQLSAEYLIKGKVKIQTLYDTVIRCVKKKSDTENQIVTIGLVVQDGLYRGTDTIMVELGKDYAPMSLEAAISTNLKIKTSKVSSKNFSLEYYINKEKERNDNYCFISMTNRVSIGIVIEGKKIDIAGKRTLDITDIINDKNFNSKVILTLEKTRGVHTTDYKLEDQKDMFIIGLARIINNVHTLFSISEIMLLGDGEKLNNEMVEMLSDILPEDINIRRTKSESKDSLRLYVQALVEKLIPDFIEHAHI
ncbi:winged helix-turn-helix DNA-binding protein [Muricomes intestini]|jgi:DNA-binding transcriptional ArsR family regulator|uniref:Winged helix-turn-helix DNA-binding protein n=1 Tax=Muricomes intestini TaxID=1796634 RepID=A0A4R3KAP9_9FIRM|nr:winged helix-turn-helix domain-containing protein [Muricomes intestini]TCS80186.1 winged helix-turn-helix DNA-binding protein [Muricomes intestini]